MTLSWLDQTTQTVSSWRVARATLKFTASGLPPGLSITAAGDITGTITKGTAGAALHPFPGFIASVCQLRPESRGFVRIKSADPRLPPAIQPRYLTSRTDRDTVVAGLHLLRRIMRQPAMRRYIAEERAPAPSATSDADLLAFARAHGTTVFHPTSTCRMGDPSRPGTVVDPSCRVLGVDNLRVIDASIFPAVPRANTNLTAIMTGELMADRLG